MYCENVYYHLQMGFTTNPSKPGTSTATMRGPIAKTST